MPSNATREAPGSTSFSNTDWSSEDLWHTYIQLTEAAFRIQESELGIRPVWHQRAGRVQAHILVCFLAYVLWSPTA